jgi:VWFA-related protein
MRLVLSTVCALVVNALALAQDANAPQLTFRTGIDLVQVDVSVLDNDRRPVLGLKPGDFVLKEDGKVRPIAAFSTVALPQRAAEPSAAWMRDVGPDVVNNLAAKEGRLVVILFDQSIGKDNIPPAKQTAEAVVDQLGPNDLAAVIYTNVGVPQNFTADRALLRAAINQPFLGIDADPDDPFAGHRGECQCGLCTLDVMTNVADAVRDVPYRRKILLFIGSGIAVSATGIECFAEVREAREKLLRAAGAANLTIHTFDSALLQTLGYSASQTSAPLDLEATARSPNLRRQNDLAFFPGETGGRAIKNTNAPWEPMPAIFAETDSYYVLGFAPSAQKADGAFHSISVEVNRPGVHVHPRKGYYSASAPVIAAAPSPNEAPASLAAAVKDLWPRTQIPMSVTTAAFATPGKPGATVAVVARAQKSAAPSQRSQVKVLARAYDRDGNPLATQVQTIVVAPSVTGQRVFQYEALCRLRLEPGRHEIRVGVEDPSRHLLGSVYTYADIPDFAKAPISLSGVVLGLRPSNSDGAFRDLFPIEPTARREFSSSSPVTAFVRVYQAQSGTVIPVALTSRIFDASNRIVHQSNVSLFHTGERASRSADQMFELPLASLTPGRYLLRIEATREPKQIARRDVIFSIR